MRGSALCLHSHQSLTQALSCHPNRHEPISSPILWTQTLAYSCSHHPHPYFIQAPIFLPSLLSHLYPCLHTHGRSLSFTKCLERPGTFPGGSGKAPTFPSLDLGKGHRKVLPSLRVSLSLYIYVCIIYVCMYIYMYF